MQLDYPFNERECARDKDKLPSHHEWTEGLGKLV